MNIKILLLIICTLLLINFVSATSIPIFVRPLTSGVINTNTPYAYEFNFTIDILCANVVLSVEKNITTDAYGLGYVEIDVSTLTDSPSYLCEYRNSSLRKVHNLSVGLFTKTYSSNNSQINGSLEVQKNITAQWIHGFYNWTVNNNGGALLSFNGNSLSVNHTYLNVTYVNIDGDDMTGNLTTTTWFNGLFNWGIGLGSNYLSFNGSTLDFNETYMNVSNDDRYVNVNGDNMTGNLNVTGDITAKNIKIYDSTGVDYSEVKHDGTNSIISTNAGKIVLSPADGFVRVLKAGTDCNFQVWDSSSNYYVQTYHDSTKGVIFVNNGGGNLILESISGEVILKAPSTITIGSGAAGIDYILKFDGETNDGTITFMEDEDIFRFSDDIEIVGDVNITKNISAYNYIANNVVGWTGQINVTCGDGTLRNITVTGGLITASGCP